MAGEGLSWELLPASKESAEGHEKELEEEESREEYHASRAIAGKKCPRERVAERAANREKR
jgi:hypothetical protein